MKHLWKALVGLAVVCLLTMPITAFAADVAVTAKSEEPTAHLTVSTDTIGFGSLFPGQSAEVALTLTNEGNIPVLVQVTITGTNAPFYKSYLTFSPTCVAPYPYACNDAWVAEETWQVCIAPAPEETPTPTPASNIIAGEKAVNLKLAIPSDNTNYGVKNAILTFWAAPVD